MRNLALPLLLFCGATVLLCSHTAAGIEAWWKQQQQQQQPQDRRHASAAIGRQPPVRLRSAAAHRFWSQPPGEHQQPPQQQKQHKALAGRPCAAGCEANGNCNRALGVCECAIGYAGANCSTLLWPACRNSPTQRELYCSSDWRPKSCECLRQCVAFVCPDGTPESCERDFDMHNAQCFERPANFTTLRDGVVWDGGSDLPDEGEAAVKYYKGRLLPGATREISRAVFVEAAPVDEIAGEAPLTSLPSSACPLGCSGNGVCVQTAANTIPMCACHFGFDGEFCEQQLAATAVDNVCWNRCSGRGTCRRGFCHCQLGWWGKDCSSSRVFAPHSVRRPLHKLRVYVYDLPWQVAYEPEYYLGFRYHDHNYQAYKVFGEIFMNDSISRTENPWEANMFYIPALTYAFSENTGDTVKHSRRAIDYVRSHFPFFNRSQGLDHFLWLTNDRGACAWPGAEEPALANVIKVVHFGWHRVGSTAPEHLPQGWQGQLHNPHFGCFHPLRDVVAAPFWLTQTQEANATYVHAAANAASGGFNATEVPRGRLLFFAGGIRAQDAEYSQGVRQQLWRMFGDRRDARVLIHAGAMGHEEYGRMLATSKFCLAPSGFGWGVRLMHYIIRGCVPVIVQDDIYQPYEDQLPYADFSVRLPRSSLPSIAELLSDIPDADYRRLRCGLARHWRAFVWDRSVGGTAYDYLIRSLKERMLRLNARHYHPLTQHVRPHSGWHHTGDPLRDDDAAAGAHATSVVEHASV